MKELKISVKSLVKPTAMDSCIKAAEYAFLLNVKNVLALFKMCYPSCLRGKRQLKVNTKSK